MTGEKTVLSATVILHVFVEPGTIVAWSKQCDMSLCRRQRHGPAGHRGEIFLGLELGLRGTFLNETTKAGSGTRDWIQSRVNSKHICILASKPTALLRPLTRPSDKSSVRWLRLSRPSPLTTLSVFVTPPLPLSHTQLVVLAT